ncbi:ADP-dependent NAD(P)H-hydrate dehydratase [Microbacterium oleivorans]|uniref:ADP-dependent NAD(P)H-hydrate dehydratase n=2 Tax=Microbacterium oleivorans TaxID=273677 RepID=UPI0007670E7B|nr:ADP/ATP-dependent (S)-NAD(P)H-hydrate dehydratase [Microbacterium oleivorans]
MGAMAAREWNSADTAAVITEPTADDDKYSRGVVGMRTGSAAFPGAAVLGVEAAWRTGVGMVRYLGPSRAADFVLARRPETVTADGRVQAWVIGSGTDAAHRSALELAALRGILSGDEPVVVDAGALDLAAHASAPVVATPHGREHARLRRMLGLDPESDDPAETATALGAVVVRKGATTVVAAPGVDPIEVTAPTSWLATAGTGDVLAGTVGAVIAGVIGRGASPGELGALQRAAASAVWLHGHAAALAVAAHGGGPIVALDVAQHLPQAVAAVLAE